MRVRMSIEDVRLTEYGLWEGRLQADDLQVFHASPKSYRKVSVIIVKDPSFKIDQYASRMTSDLLRASLANRGGTDRERRALVAWTSHRHHGQARQGELLLV